MEKRKLKQRENLVVVKGVKKHPDVIVSQYIGLMESIYNLSINEIVSYLDCSVDYFQKNYVDKIKHSNIDKNNVDRINSVL